MPVAYAAEPAERPDAGSQVASLDGDAPQPMDIGVRPAIDAVSAVGGPSSSRGTGAKTDVIGQSLSNMLLGAPPAPLGSTRASAPLVPPVGIGRQNRPIDLFTSGGISSHQVAEAALAVEAAVLGPKSAAPAAASAPLPAAPPPGSWIVQIGAAPTSDGANTLLSSASDKVATLNDMRPYVERFDKNGQTYYRARFVGFGSRDEASDICGQLKKEKMSCLALQG
jgi:D-alanyl-D-alanine carboxypeptidase